MPEDVTPRLSVLHSQRGGTLLAPYEGTLKTVRIAEREVRRAREGRPVVPVVTMQAFVEEKTFFVELVMSPEGALRVARRLARRARRELKRGS